MSTRRWYTQPCLLRWWEVPVFIAYNNQQRILLVRCAGTKSLQQPSPWQQEQWDKLSPWVVLFGKPHPSLGDDVAGLWIRRSQQKFNLTIVVSNGINEQVVHTLTSQQEHGMLPPRLRQCLGLLELYRPKPSSANAQTPDIQAIYPKASLHATVSSFGESETTSELSCVFMIFDNPSDSESEWRCQEK